MSKKQKNFSIFLKTNNLYIQIPEKKLNIEGSYSTL